MDLLPYNDLLNSANIARYGELANDKLKEAQGIVQSALDVHMLLSHYDVYKNLVNNIGDTVSDVTSDLKNNILGSNLSNVEGGFDPLALWNQGQEKIRAAQNIVSQIKNAQSDAQATLNNTITKFKQMKDDAAEELETFKSNMSDTSDELQQTGAGIFKTVKQGGEQVLKNTSKMLDETKSTIINKGNTLTKEMNTDEDINDTMNRLLSGATMSDPAEAPLLSKLSSTGQDLVGMTSNKAINDYYAAGLDDFPDDIFADIPKDFKINYVPAQTKKLLKKGLKKLKKKQPVQETEEEQTGPKYDPAAQAQAQVQRTTGDISSPQQVLPEDDISTMTEEELTSEINSLSGARSPLAEARYQRLTNQLSKVQQNKAPTEPAQENKPTMEEEDTQTVTTDAQPVINNESEGERLLSSVNGEPKINLELPDVEEAAQNLQNTTNEIIQGAADEMRTFTTSLTNTAIGTAEEVGQNALTKAKNALFGATEDSLEGDEDPIGLGVTVALGLADLGTQIAQFFDKPKPQQIVEPGQQVGV